ncbi:MAG: phosphodiesterase, partial [Hyphomicrobiales bacterium]
MAEESADERLLQFLYRAPIGLVEMSLDGTITLINPMAAQLLMPLAADASLENLFDVLKDVAPGLRDLAHRSTRFGDLVCDAMPLRSERPGTERGDAITLGLHMMRMDDRTFMACVSDMTATVEREDLRIQSRLHHQRRTDALTALPNRTAVLERIAITLDRMRRDRRWHFVLMIVNADRFERINVTLGHVIGDELLRLVGRRIATAGQQWENASALTGAAQACMTARLGADEFVLCFGELLITMPAAISAAERVVSMLQEPYEVHNRSVHLSASVGVVMAHSGADEAEALLEQARLAMREAKRAGGARYAIFEPALMDQARERGDLELGLRFALARGELFTVYQPIVDLRDGSVSGMEALIRWRHPERGLVMPDEFITVAEATGLICELGDWIINDTCRQLSRWRALMGERAPGAVSVNLSRAQLADRDIVVRVHDALRTAGLPPKCLQLEVTESLAAQDELVRSRLNELKSLGLSLALDDFGTGYSSLASLQDLPIDVVKIDRSFVSPLGSSTHHRVLVESVVRIAKSLGMRTVAEGV